MKMGCKACEDGTCMAHGGSVDEGPSEKANQMGVHKIVPNYEKGKGVKHGQSEARYGDKKAVHAGVMSELKAMPKPNLKGLAHGGMAEDGEDMDMDGGADLHDAVAGELMDAFHSKDKQGMLDALKALILSCKE